MHPTSLLLSRVLCRGFYAPMSSLVSRSCVRSFDMCVKVKSKSEEVIARNARTRFWCEFVCDQEQVQIRSPMPTKPARGALNSITAGPAPGLLKH